MNYSFFIANRYFQTNSSRNFVHIISWISNLGIIVGTASLILLLSVFNGFESIVLSMYNTFDPDLKLSTSSGDVFDPTQIKFKNDIENKLKHKAYVLEENILLRFQNKDYIAKAKGVSKEYLKMTNFDSLLVEGSFINQFDENNVAVLGRGVAYHLSFGNISIFNQLQIIIPSREKKTLLNLSSSFNQSSVTPVGIFSVQSEIDDQFIITPLSFLQDLSKRNNDVSYIEIKIKDQKKLYDIQKQISEQLGSKFKIENRYQQQAFLYKILRTEKLAVFLILIFIMVIAAFNIIGALCMLILDKTNDITILKTLGCSRKDIKLIFFQKSILSIVFGISVGILLGLLIAFLQQKFGFIQLGEDNFIINHYPIKFIAKDILFSVLSVFLIGIVATVFSIQVLTNRLFKNKI